MSTDDKSCCGACEGMRHDVPGCGELDTRGLGEVGSELSRPTRAMRGREGAEAPRNGDEQRPKVSVNCKSHDIKQTRRATFTLHLVQQGLVQQGRS